MKSAVVKKVAITSLLLVFVSLAGLGCNNGGNTTSTQNTNSSDTTNTPDSTTSTDDTSFAADFNKKETGALTFAKEVTNLYGTYASDYQYSNLKQLERYMTTERAAATETFISDSLGKTSGQPASPYVEVTTKAKDATVTKRDTVTLSWTIEVTADQLRTGDKDSDNTTTTVTYIVGVEMSGTRYLMNRISKK